ncbi:hypothetical protein MLD38_000284 [Melastoma candidum]|nr:hypothetical protein MLD38_000284 [Melastoma candidum]
MMSGCSAASAVGYVGKYGEEKMGWMPLCDRITRFCNRITVSVSFSFVAMFCFLALTLSSASNLMSRLP